jgi:hypothetical protein
VHSPADNTFLPSIVPIHSNNVARPKKQKLQAQISYPNQFATAIVTSTGALIAALKAREVEVVSLQPDRIVTRTIVKLSPLDESPTNELPP